MTYTDRRPRATHLLAFVLLLLLGCAAALAAAGCGGGSQSCAGKERCACYPNSTCNTGLSCLSNVCVNAGDGDAGADVPSPGAGGNATGAGGAGTGGASTGTGGSGAGTGGSGAGAGGATSGTGGSAPPVDGAACRLFETVPGGGTEAPTVFVLVDRSGSMFSCVGGGSSTACSDPTNTAWAVFRGGVLDVVQRLQGVVRFGFGAFTGNTATAACPIFDQVATRLDNYSSISTLYSSLGALGVKAETPVGAALDRVKTILAADATPGPKYILFVTDGQPDFCDDGNAVCPTDSVIAHLQALKAGGITTLIFGVQNGMDTTVPLPTLQAFANAGAGQPVMALTTPVEYTADQCTSSTAWRAEQTAAGKSGRVPLGTYASSGGGATVYKPDPADKDALTNLLATTIAAVKSCTFDLANGLSVDLAMLDRARVTIEGQDVPHDDANGWRMKNTVQLELMGGACTLWRLPTTRTIDFNFPCGVVRGS